MYKHNAASQENNTYNTYPERVACAEGVGCGRVETLGVVDIVEDDCHGVVGEVGYHREPNRTRPDEEIAEERTHQHTGNKAVELEVDEGEDDGCCPDGKMSLSPFAFRRSLFVLCLLFFVFCPHEKIHQYPTEAEFFTEGREDSHEENVEKKDTEVVGTDKSLGEQGSRLFLLLHQFLQRTEKVGQRELLIPVTQEIDSWQGNHHHRYGEKRDLPLRSCGEVQIL